MLMKKSLKKILGMDAKEASNLFEESTLSKMEISKLMGGVKQRELDQQPSSLFTDFYSIVTQDPDWCDVCACPKSSCRCSKD